MPACTPASAPSAAESGAMQPVSVNIPPTAPDATAATKAVKPTGRKRKAAAAPTGQDDLSPAQHDTPPVKKVGKKRKAKEIGAGVPEAEEEKGSEEKGEKGAPAKKRVEKAKAAFCRDLPDWGERTDCVLLDKLPAEVFDKCFSPDTSLQMQDWVSLAGVSRFFRDRLDDDFFHHIFHLQGRQPVIPWAQRNEPHTVPTPSITFTKPPGPRAAWTYEQYTKYKTDKRSFAVTQRKARAERAELAATQAAELRKKNPTRKIKSQYFTAVVAGLKDGEVIGAKAAGETAASEATPSGQEKEEGDEAVGVPITNDERGWQVPDTDGEDDLEPEIVRRYDDKGNRMRLDGWPSEWRFKCAEELNDTWITLTDAKKNYKVTKPELVTLKHGLAPYNNRYPNRLTQLFRVPAVRALAYRSHGGYLGHIDHMLEKAQKAKQTAANKKAKLSAETAVAAPEPQQTEAPATTAPRRVRHVDAGWGFHYGGTSLFANLGQDDGCSF
ncbi:uncharacterized protein MKK02DRAFT_39104 [Dioszegia hungarica]|uniref:Uncharacterized protein n=1 Tax=Dioszegia hungarica TaxID=4972 RepID=A0AA38H2R2_9TREE|nr:uncharacterized protein MKK02DRAFT_39104 [Dioszegia hungarica]KAI9633128.1 hypothetical protein MKK02DRAFT_39104 [Dioszegia hungarica]